MNLCSNNEINTNFLIKRKQIIHLILTSFPFLGVGFYTLSLEDDDSSDSL